MIGTRAFPALPELQPDSGKRLPVSILHGMYSSPSQTRYQLIRVRTPLGRDLSRNWRTESRPDRIHRLRAKS